MRNKWIKRFFPFFATLLLLPWPVAYAYDINAAAEEAIRIEPAEASAQPSYTVFGRAIGGVTNPGDLFYIDATNYTTDIKTTLYLTNAHELINCYTYLIFKVGVYVESDDGEWEWATGSNGEQIPETVISMRNGQSSFLLPGYAKYKVAIDSGAFYCTSARSDGSGLSPQFYLEAD